MTPPVSKTQAAAVLQAVIAVAVVLGAHPDDQTKGAILALAGVLAVALSWADIHLRRAHLHVDLGHRLLNTIGDAAAILSYLHDELAAAAHDGSPSPAPDPVGSMVERIKAAATADQAAEQLNGPPPQPGTEPLGPPPAAPDTHGTTF